MDEYNLTREDMGMIWTTKNILGPYEKKLLVCHHRTNHCTFKTLIQLSKRGIITTNINKAKNTPPFSPFLFGNYHKRPQRNKGNHTGGSTRNTSDNRYRAMNSLDHLISSQSGNIYQSNRVITYNRLWPCTVFLVHYYN